MHTEVKTVGSRAEVYHGKALHTRGNLRKSDLVKIKGRIVSKKKRTKSLKKSDFRDWAMCVKKARAELIRKKVIKRGEFVPLRKYKTLGILSSKGNELYKLAKKYYEYN